MNTAYHGVRLQQLEPVVPRAGIDHGAIVARPCRRLGILRHQADQPGDQGIFSNIAESGHDVVSN